MTLNASTKLSKPNCRSPSSSNLERYSPASIGFSRSDNVLIFFVGLNPSGLLLIKCHRSPGSRRMLLPMVRHDEEQFKGKKSRLLTPKNGWPIRGIEYSK